MKKCIVLLSGGLDSSVLLAHCVKFYGGAENVIALFAHYGQVHLREVRCAETQATSHRVFFKTLDLSRVYKNNRSSLITGQDIPKEEYESGKTPSTYVPMRNALMLIVAAIQGTTFFKDGEEFDVAYAGHLNDDQAAYPDCSQQFVDTMRTLLNAHGIGLYAPFIDSSWTKAQIVYHGQSLGVDFKNTWSCYQGGQEPCGECGTCRDRSKAFSLAGLADPAMDKE